MSFLTDYFKDLSDDFYKNVQSAEKYELEKKKLVQDILNSKFRLKSKFKKLHRFLKKQQEPFIAKLSQDFVHFSNTQERIQKIIEKRGNQDIAEYYALFVKAIKDSKDDLPSLLSSLKQEENSNDKIILESLYKNEQKFIDRLNLNFAPVMHKGNYLIKKYKPEELIKSYSSFSNIRLGFVKLTMSVLIFFISMAVYDNATQHTSGQLENSGEKVELRIPFTKVDGHVQTFKKMFYFNSQPPNMLLPINKGSGYRLVRTNFASPGTHIPNSPRGMYRGINGLQRIPDAPQGYKYAGKVKAIVTAYTPFGPGLMAGKNTHFEDGFTSTMRDANLLDGVAVDPKLIPYGCKVLIDGQGFKLADDTGGRMRKHGNKGLIHIDVRMGDLKTALAFGRKDIEIPIFVPINSADDRFAFVDADKKLA